MTKPTYWIKLYLEVLDDPKMGTMSDSLWRRTVELFLLAGKTQLDGTLPGLVEMAWQLHIPTDRLQRDLDELAARGIVSQQTDGNWFIVHFADRQGPSDPAERKRAERARAQRARPITTPSQNVTQPVTKRDSNVTTPVTECDPDQTDQSDQNRSTDQIRSTDHQTTEPPPVELSTELSTSSPAPGLTACLPAAVHILDQFGIEEPARTEYANTNPVLIRAWCLYAQARPKIRDLPAFVVSKLAAKTAPPGQFLTLAQINPQHWNWLKKHARSRIDANYWTDDLPSGLDLELAELWYTNYHTPIKETANA